ncbi:MAG: RDD family protein, partial [Pseudomonadota bacterium]
PIGGLPAPDAARLFSDGAPARRLIAFLIDVALVWGAAALFVLMTLGLGIFILGFVVAVIDFLYRSLTIGGRSATFGMRLMRVELRDGDGDRFSLAQAIGHTLLFYVSLTFVVVHLISVIMMAGSSMGRALHDLPFGSTVINSPA